MIVCLPLDPEHWPDFDSGWDWDKHPGDCHPRMNDGFWSTCCAECAGTGVWPVPWISTVDQGRTDPLAGCVSCKNTGRAIVALAVMAREVAAGVR